MSGPLGTVVATREQLQSAVDEQAALHAQALARDTVEHHDRVFLERESELRQHASDFVEALRAEHAQEKQQMSDKVEVLEVQNAGLQAAWSAAQAQSAQLQQQAQRMQEQLEQLQAAFAAQSLAQRIPPSSTFPSSSHSSPHPKTSIEPRSDALPAHATSVPDDPLVSGSGLHGRQPSSLSTQSTSVRFQPYTPGHSARSRATHAQAHASKKTTQATKKKIQVYQFQKDLRPSDLDSGTELAMRIHFHALTGCLEPNTVIPPPERHEKEAFLTQFTSSAQLSAAQKGPDLIARDLIQCVQIARRTEYKGKRGYNMRLLPDAAVSNMQSHCSRRMISRFAPDPYEPHDSLWNEAHWNIWVESFIEALTAKHYSFCHANPKFADPLRRGDLRSMYQHIALYSQAERTRKEVSTPGSTQRRANLDSSRRGRERTCTRRVLLATLRGDPARQIEALQSLRAHSETRRNPLTNEQERCAMPFRSAAFTSYVEDLDAWGIAHSDEFNLPALPARKTVSNPPRGLTKRLPEDAPLDFWDVDKFNNSPISFRAAVANLWIALPGDVPYNHQNPAITYPYDQFVSSVGRSIMERYDIAGKNQGMDEADYSAFLADDADHGDETEMQGMQDTLYEQEQQI